MQVHTAPWKVVGRVAFTPDGGSLLAACSPGGVVRFEPGRTGPVNRYKSGWPGPGDLDVHPGGAWAVTANNHGGMELLRLPDLRRLNSPPAPFAQYVAYARAGPDGASVLVYHFAHGPQVASPYGVALRQVNPDFTTDPFWIRSTRNWVILTACFAAGGRVVVTAEKNGWGRATRCQLAVCDAGTGAVRRLIPFSCGHFDQLTPSPDGRTVCLRFGAKLRVWAIDEEEPLADLGTGRLHFTGIAFHPSGKYLAATSNDETVKLYDTQSWELAKTYTWEVGRLRSVCFAPDGTRAAVGSDSGKVVVWDLDI